ncbi:hypothetical protein L3X38_000613 [Prunus dulcis]|uniref:Uncharacterized protein n=1 Tax=Prunus dulcis TaxID=3755 RepID=A0AAD4WR10_PRUDU|nr:hypothetical protein L3X38_000613 [Prunus dulcis]
MWYSDTTVNSQKEGYDTCDWVTPVCRISMAHALDRTASLHVEVNGDKRLKTVVPVQMIEGDLIIKNTMI